MWIQALQQLRKAVPSDSCEASAQQSVRTRFALAYLPFDTGDIWPTAVDVDDHTQLRASIAETVERDGHQVTETEWLTSAKTYSRKQRQHSNLLYPPYYPYPPRNPGMYAPRVFHNDHRGLCDTSVIEHES